MDHLLAYSLAQSQVNYHHISAKQTYLLLIGFQLFPAHRLPYPTHFFVLKDIQRSHGVKENDVVHIQLNDINAYRQNAGFCLFLQRPFPICYWDSNRGTRNIPHVLGLRRIALKYIGSIKPLHIPLSFLE